MARAVLPRATADELWLPAGRADRGDGTGDRAPPLDQDGTEEDSENRSAMDSSDDQNDFDMQEDIVRSHLRR